MIRDRINRLDVAVTKARRESPLAAEHVGIEQGKTAARLNGKGIGPIDWFGTEPGRLPDRGAGFERRLADKQGLVSSSRQRGGSESKVNQRALTRHRGGV